jgi:hypothetical protein
MNPQRVANVRALGAIRILALVTGLAPAMYAQSTKVVTPRRVAPALVRKVDSTRKTTGAAAVGTKVVGTKVIGPNLVAVPQDTPKTTVPKRIAWPAARIAAGFQLPKVDTSAKQDTRPLSPEMDSLSRALASPSWPARAEAVARLNEHPVADIPKSVASRMIDLLNREGAADTTGGAGRDQTGNEADAEARSEYLIALSDGVLRFRDERSLAGLALLGIQTSSEAQRFVASRGAASLPYLELAVRAKPRAAPHAVTTMAYVLRDTRQLSQTDSARALATIMHASAEHPIAFTSASRIAGIRDAAPLLARISETQTNELVKASAVRTTAQLRATRLVVKPDVQVGQLAQTLAAACNALPTATPCSLPNRLLSLARTAIAKQDSKTAKDELEAFAVEIERQVKSGSSFTQDQGVVLSQSARDIKARL